MRIWKWALVETDEQVVKMPTGAVVLSVQTQNGRPCLWALADEAAPLEDRVFRTFGTGHSIEGDPGRFVGTYQIAGGQLVFHVFEVVK